MYPVSATASSTGSTGSPPGQSPSGANANIAARFIRSVGERCGTSDSREEYQAASVLRDRLGHRHRSGGLERGEFSTLMPLRELEERCPDETPQCRRTIEILCPNARLREVLEGLHQEHHILKGDPRVGIVPEPRVGPRPHQHEHIAASEEARDFDVQLPSDDVFSGPGEVRLGR